MIHQELSGRDADVNVVSNQQMQLTMAAAGRVPVGAVNPRGEPLDI